MDPVLEPEPEPKLFQNRNRNRYKSLWFQSTTLLDSNFEGVKIM
jgi:hypothetical protein